jgi:hypothetical protein
VLLLHVLRGVRHELTALGFRYLLKGTNEQVWILLREYIKTAEQTSGGKNAAAGTSTQHRLGVVGAASVEC